MSAALAGLKPKRCNCGRQPEVVVQPISGAAAVTCGCGARGCSDVDRGVAVLNWNQDLLGFGACARPLDHAARAQREGDKR